jgi:hypothetical protein
VNDRCERCYAEDKSLVYWQEWELPEHFPEVAALRFWLPGTSDRVHILCDDCLTAMDEELEAAIDPAIV